MSEVQQKHEFYELREQYVAEQFWPVGGPAQTLSAVLMGKIIANRIGYDAQTQKDIKVIMEMLEGTFKPPKKIKKGVTKEQLKQSFGIKR